MAVIQPTASTRTVPSGYYNRHTAVTSAGVGIPGGIKQYRPGQVNARDEFPVDLTGYNPGDDISSAVNTQVAAAKANFGGRVIIPAGNWAFDGTINLTNEYAQNIVICGQGIGVTNLTKNSNGAFINMGNSSNWNYPVGEDAMSVNTLDQGSTTFEFANSSLASAFSAGGMIRISIENLTDNTDIAAGAIPVFAVEGNNDTARKHIARVTSVAGAVVTFSPPIPFPIPSGLGVYGYSGYGPVFTCNGSGLEDFSLTFTDSSTAAFGIRADDCWGCWLFNVEIRGGSNVNYNVYWANCVRMEMRGCVLSGPTIAGPNHAGIRIDTCSSVLVEDNIFEDLTQSAEVNASTNCSVFCFNYAADEFNINHNPDNYANLYASNIVDYFISDGYFGPSEADTIIGNWAITNSGIIMRRFAFNANVYGNINGVVGDTTAFDWVDGQGVANIGGIDDTSRRSEFLTGDFPASWPYPLPTQYVRLNSIDGFGVGEWEFLGTAYGRENVGMERVLLETVGFTDYNATVDAGEKKFYSKLINGGAINPEWVGQSFAMLGAGVKGYQEHNDDVWNTMDFRGNFNLLVNVTNYPTQSIGADTIWNPLGYTSAPAGDGIDEVNWDGCPWYTNGGVQYGFINRSAPEDVSIRDLPAGKAYDDGVYTRYNQSSPTPPQVGDMTIGGTLTVNTLRLVG